MMPRDTERDEQAPGLAENRAHPRVKVHSLAYIELGEGNAGLILNISEKGMAIQAVQTISSNYFPRMHFRLPRTEAPIQTAGKVVWQINPKKEIGIEFDAISEQTRDVIRKWIAGEDKRQSESEEIHQRSLEDIARPEPQGTAFQKYPSESGDEDEDMEIPVPIVPSGFSAADFPSLQAKPENGVSPTGQVPKVAEPPAPIAFPAVPRRVPDRWRPEAKTSETHVAEQRPGPARQPERIFGNAAWNRQPMVPTFGIEPARKRPKWPYVLTAIFLVAVTVAGVTTLDPSLINRERIDGWLGGITASSKDAPANSASPTQQQNAAAANTKTATPSTTAQTPPVAPATQSAGSTASENNSPNGQANAPSNAAPTATQTSQASGNTNASPAQPPAQTAESGRSEGSQPSAASATDTAQRPGAASRPELQSQANGVNGHEVPTRSIQNVVPSTNKQFADSRSAMPANNRAPSYGSRPANSRAQAPAGQAATDSGALQAYRAQTTLPTPSNSAPGSTNRAQNRTAARQSNQYQNAYANSAPYTASRSDGTAQSATQPSVFIVEMSGYASTPVPPSGPLSGVPSGSVAANSQLHSISVPTNLEWAQHYLPGNLGVGRLLSSYSPAYPVEAAREGIQGTVKLDVTVATDGTVRSVHVLAGPPALARSAVSAVYDWRYGTSFLAGQSIEVEQYVSVIFRLAPAR